MSLYSCLCATVEKKKKRTQMAVPGALTTVVISRAFFSFSPDYPCNQGKRNKKPC